MTSRLYGECINCNKRTCIGCSILGDIKVEVGRVVTEVGDKQKQSDTTGGGSTPKQYGIPDGVTDLQDLIEYRNMNFSLGNIFKACYRFGFKNDNLYELNKMKWFVERLIEAEERDNGRLSDKP